MYVVYCCPYRENERKTKLFELNNVFGVNVLDVSCPVSLEKSNLVHLFESVRLYAGVWFLPVDVDPAPQPPTSTLLRVHPCACGACAARKSRVSNKGYPVT